jgi:DNA polymerase
MSPGLPSPAQLLAANLACRRRLGLPLVRGGPAELAELARRLGPAAAAPAGPAARGLEEAGRKLAGCRLCALHQGRRQVVYGKGSESARVLVIGEGPGEEEDRQGRPFVGPAGKLLDRMLAAVGLEPAEVYITNIVKCRPPGNRDPRPEEAAACRPFLEEQVRILGPELVLALGRPAAQSLLNSKAPIGALRGSWHQFRGVPLMPTFHPAYLLRSPEKKGQAYQDLKALARALRQGVMEVKP